jgi:hypothetical protein
VPWLRFDCDRGYNGAIASSRAPLASGCHPQKMAAIMRFATAGVGGVVGEQPI